MLKTDIGTESGYAHLDYAAALTEFGRPRCLTRSGGWILEREIPGTQESDAMGCYPLFSCCDWSLLEDDIESISGGLVSIALVTDPFGDYTYERLRRTFKGLVVPFKEHFVVDLKAAETFVHPHHRRKAARALQELYIQQCINPADCLDEWTTLYKTLIKRHGISGIAVFSRESFAKQLRVPGIVAFRAVHRDDTVGMLLWYVQGNRAYYHLGAYSPRGYELQASFALFNYAIEYFARHGFEWLNLGAGAGREADAESGLSRFKRGWSNGVRMAYFCGRIFDQEKYQELTVARNVPATDYFPAYRVGEFS